MRRDEFPYRMSDYTVQIELQPTPEGHVAYFASVDELLGCDSDGATPEEARRNLEEAFELYVSTSLADGVPVPPPRTPDKRLVKETVWRDLTAEYGLAGAA